MSRPDQRLPPSSPSSPSPSMLRRPLLGGDAHGEEEETKAAHTAPSSSSSSQYHYDSSHSDEQRDLLSVKTTSTGRRGSDVGICWLHPPEEALDLDWLLSIRGAENLYLYFWLLKDLSWAQDWYYPAYVFGALAIASSFVMVVNTVVDQATNEIFFSTAVFLWIFANFWWMTGDIHDYVLGYPDDAVSDWYDQRTPQAAIIMEFGISWLAFFYLVVKPFKLFGADDPEKVAEYDTTGLPPRWPMFFKVRVCVCVCAARE
jgi:hypothetical protein